MMKRKGPDELFRPERLLAFSDGVFGVAITLLVIDLKLPSIAEGAGDGALLQALSAIGPKIFIFAFTFIIVGMSWLGHHRKFSHVERVDGTVLWMNLLYLMTLCLVPFASSVLSDNGSNRFAFILYAVVMILVEITSAALSAYVLRKPYLAEADGMPTLWRSAVVPPLCTSFVFVLAGVIAFAGYLRMAHWTLLLIVPAIAYFRASRT